MRRIIFTGQHESGGLEFVLLNSSTLPCLSLSYTWHKFSILPEQDVFQGFCLRHEWQYSSLISISRSRTFVRGVDEKNHIRNRD